MQLKTFEEESIVDVVRIMRERRVSDQTLITGWHKEKYEHYMHKSAELARFIHEYTSGKFYYNTTFIAFENPEDLVIFKMWFKK